MMYEFYIWTYKLIYLYAYLIYESHIMENWTIRAGLIWHIEATVLLGSIVLQDPSSIEKGITPEIVFCDGAQTW